MRYVLVLLALTPLAAAQQPAFPPPLAITHVTIIDTKGGPLQPDMTVVVQDGRITSIQKSSGVAPKGAQSLDGRGKFLIPGLWDMHVHLSWSKASTLPVYIAKGVTGVRDMGGRLGEIDEWRTQIAAGLLVGPRIFRVGPILNGQKFNTYQMVPGNPDETRGVARALKEVGVDFIKVHRRLPRDSYSALMDEAKRLGIPVVGHIPMTVTPEEASDAGQATIEHTETLFEGTFSRPLKESELPAAIRQFRANDGEKLFARFVKNRTVVTPTLAPHRSLIASMDPSSPLDPHSRYVALSLRKEWQQRTKPASADELALMKQTFAELRQVVGQMNRAGVTLLAGTDTAGARVPGFSMHEELALLVEAGLTPLQALQAATLTPARVLGKAEEVGSVETGKLADLVLLDANPLEDIRNTQGIHAVVWRGRLLRSGDLQALLSQAEEMAGRN